MAKLVIPGWVLVFLGAFLLTAAFLCAFWAPAQVERVPLDVDTTTYLKGEADKLNIATGELEHHPVKVTSVTRVDPKLSDGDIAVWVNTTCVNIDTNNPPDCLSEDDPRMITDTIEKFATDRHTGVAVNDASYIRTDTKYEGLVNKFPFNTEKKTYQYWDGLTEKAVPATYTGTETIQGLQVYRFDTAIRDASIELGPGIKGIYNLTKTMWVEPRTGAIINQEQHDVRTVADGGTKVLDMTIAFTPETVSANVDTANDNLRLLNLVSRTVPLVGFILGPLLIIGGGALIVLARRRSPEPESSPTGEHAYAG